MIEVLIILLTVYVLLQGELIDRIERNVENAGVYVDHGNREVKRARTAKRTGQRVKIWLGIKYKMRFSSMLIFIDEVGDLLCSLWLLLSDSYSCYYCRCRCIYLSKQFRQQLKKKDFVNFFF